MRFLLPLLLHGAHSAPEQEVADHVAVFAERLASYPAWPELADLDACPGCEVPPTDRPREPSDAGQPQGTSPPSGGSATAPAASVGAR